MKVTEYISNTTDRLPKGYVSTYEDFSVEVKKKEATIKALNRMVDSGKPKKLSKGKYFKPECTSSNESELTDLKGGGQWLHPERDRVFGRLKSIQRRIYSNDWNIQWENI